VTDDVPPHEVTDQAVDGLLVADKRENEKQAHGRTPDQELISIGVRSEQSSPSR
jgi:hypothetical protein